MMIPRPNPPISNKGIALESEYADDAELLDESKEVLEKVITVASNILQQWSLFVNDSKTVHTRVYLADSHEVDTHGNKIRGKEEWRDSVLLGSKLSSIEDIKNRCNKANAAFHTYNKVWITSSVKISESRKIKLYEALVTSTLLYNCSSWAVPANVFESLNILQRKHLRQILKMNWPVVISNNSLYKRCEVKPITDRVHEARWKMLGHILRSGENTPAFLAFKFAYLGCKNYKGRLGRPRTNLFDLIVKDLKQRNIIIQNDTDFNNLVYVAHDKSEWRNIYLRDYSAT